MPRIAYLNMNLGPAKRRLIDQANEIIAEYQAAGYELTLRQLYYQFVSRDLLPNKQQEYKRLGDAINDGRMAGLIDWNAIIDRTRNLESVSHWNEPGDVIKSAADSFRMDKWATQERRIEVWVEKDALVGVMERACVPLDVPYFACRGYTSQSEMWAAGMRLKKYARAGQGVSILHLGDHDPSGIDMSRDIEDRIRLFMGREAGAFDFERLALNEDQVTRYAPPPNPAKLSDSRAAGYVDRFGDESWELDALDPAILNALVTRSVKAIRDEEAWAEAVEIEEKHRAALRVASQEWDALTIHLDEDRIEREIAKERGEETTDDDEDEEPEAPPPSRSGWTCEATDCGQPIKKHLFGNADGDRWEGIVHVDRRIDKDHPAYRGGGGTPMTKAEVRAKYGAEGDA